MMLLRGTTKSLVRSIRISQELETSLESEARNKRMSVNALIGSILEKYNEWDRVAEKFSFLTIPRETIRELIRASDEKSIEKISRELGGRLPKEIMQFWFGGCTVGTFISYISLLSRYQRLFEYEIMQSGRTITITAHHDLGPKWSIWIMNYLGEAIRSSFNVVPSTSHNSNTVTIRYDNP